MPINDDDINIMIQYSTYNLFANNYSNMKRIIEDVQNYITKNDPDYVYEDLEDDYIISLLMEYRKKLLFDCYNNKYKNNKIKFKEQIEWLYNHDFHDFSSSLIVENGNTKSLNKIFNHFNNEGKFTGKPGNYYYSALRLEKNHEEILPSIFEIHIARKQKEQE